MNKKTIRDVDVRGKKVLVRVDFNVPLEDGQITDDTRIRAALPTLQYALAQGAALVLMSHFGRPKGKGFEAEFSLKPVAARLQELLGRPVALVPDCIGAAAQQAAAALQPGQVLLLENTRFHVEEEGKAKTEGLDEAAAKAAKSAMKKKQEEMAKQLAALGDVYVNDAFGAAHRAHASTAVVAKFTKTAVAGFLMEKDLEYLGKAVGAPERPFVAIIGGAKISGKLEVLQNLLKKVDVLIIGGGMAYTFFKAQGRPIGKSLCENDLVQTAKDTLAAAQQAGVKLLLPVDDLIADGFSETAKTQVCSGPIPDGWMGLDIGPQSIALFTAEIAKAKTIVWNGPLGAFEMAPFAKGTMAVCRAVANAQAVSIVGGGDSVAAVGQSGLGDKITHISTGGGASLEFLEGKVLPGAAALNDK